MRIKTSELINHTLDWAVATIEGWDQFDEDGVPIVQLDSSHMRARWDLYSPSIDWGVGGYLIEREQIELQRGNDLYFPKGNEKGDFYEPLWLASIGGSRKFHGQTALISAMRAFVASRLGDEVEIPEELV